ncbi:protein-serine O-palmitoleoyltransferase porcupine [Musca vetustissima]|uniref:protein-serine O-palmitoleoyltransferase porcupine n=1 Tax=Musca vetustissima TaxID=27455 RepID=UPI002AB7DCAE|nr:protein-serine O-palmitoleoyltransferase porcupine [Musca vetustissima]
MDYYYYDEQIQENGADDEDYEYDDAALGDETFTDVCKGCMLQTTHQIQQYIIILLGCGLVHRILWQILKQIREIKTAYHILSIACGLLSLWLYVGPSTLYVIINIVNICSFVRVFNAFDRIGHKGLWSCTYIIFSQLLAESLLKHDKFESIRGPQMVVSMKMISVAFELQDGRETFQWIPIIGYLCSPSSLILGPWVPYKMYKDHNKISGKKLKQIFNIILYIILSIFYLNLSNCLLPWLKQLWNGGLWYRTYMDALSVRCSHYFISYLSHATLLSNIWSPSSSLLMPSAPFRIVKPLEIEFPRSLAMAIRNWNIPMHMWLKSTIFQRMRSSYVFAILITYLVSCLVHGFNYLVYCILISLGLFSYFENKLRRTLAQVFNACIESTPCRNSCKYKHCTRNSRLPWYTTQSLLVRLVNAVFSFITLLQLAYLGVMLNSNNSSASPLDNLLVWSNMNFFGHWLASTMALFYFAI